MEAYLRYAGAPRLKFCRGGVYNAWLKYSNYFLHSLYPESCDSLCTITYISLMRILEIYEPTEFSIALDGHSTGKCFKFLCFVEWLVRVEQVFGKEGEAHIVFFECGHSVSEQDSMNGISSVIVIYHMNRVF